MVTVVIPWVDRGEPSRQTALNYVRSFWATLGGPDWEIIVSSPDPFDWGKALNDGIRKAANDLILHSDPDSVVPAGQVMVALQLAAQADGLVTAHDRFLYLTERVTRKLLTISMESVNPLLFDEEDAEDNGAGGVGNVNAFSKRTWELAHGYDERFGTWGGADGAFAYACDAFTGQTLRRAPGPMYHLWHPRLPESIPGSPEYARKFALVAKYRDAAAEGPDAVKALVALRDDPTAVDRGIEGSGDAALT